ncbi:MAG: hypothetical protein ABSB65_10670 [Candidatus Acidiferrales bacterium]|jgi:hypothetical protein
MPLAPLKLWLVLLSFAAFASIARGQDSQSQPQSLGDVAREARAAKSSAPKSAVVLDDDNLPKSKSGAAAGGKLSPDKQAFCDQARQRKDPAAEQICAVLAIDMGSEYENMTARYVEVAKNACGGNGGHFPKSDPKDPSLAAKYKELSEISGKFEVMMDAELKTLKNSEAALNAIRMEKYREEYAEIPDMRTNADFMANPEEKQRFFEIEAKYKSREQEKDDAANQQRSRGLRYVYDMARLQELCHRN